MSDDVVLLTIRSAAKVRRALGFRTGITDASFRKLATANGVQLLRIGGKSLVKFEDALFNDAPAKRKRRRRMNEHK